MVVRGFSLFDLRKLYLDELFEFYEELFYTLEQQGEVKEGTYDKIVLKDNEKDVKATVNALRSGILGAMSHKK